MDGTGGRVMGGAPPRGEVVVVLGGSVVVVVLGGSVVVVVLGGSVVAGCVVVVAAGDVSGGAGGGVVAVVGGLADGGRVVEEVVGGRVVAVPCGPGPGDGGVVTDGLLPPLAGGPGLLPPTVVLVELVPTPSVVPLAAFLPI